MPRPIENPPNPWSHTHAEWLGEQAPAQLRVLEESARSILSRNDSADLPFRYSLNPYRGCMHACAYCYARPTHGYWGLDAGTDFEQVIFVKPKAPDLLRQRLAHRSWEREPIVMSGNTDCYQPLEANYALTRRCLQAFLSHRSPVSIITKASLIRRDLDLLSELAKHKLVQVHLSIPSLNDKSGKLLEPHTPSPASRFETMRQLHEAGIPVGISVSPVVPGLNDHEITQLLERAKQCGAAWAWMTPLRLPAETEQVFFERLKAQYPDHAQKIRQGFAELQKNSSFSKLADPRSQEHKPLWRSLQLVFSQSCERLELRHSQGLTWPQSLLLQDPRGFSTN
ncbi:MAG: radical SAM protein [Planctomycetota bacterium]|nr:MAG: radical SAM protein [Planctomycetota bacterium]